MEPTRWARQAAYLSSWPRSQDHYILGWWIDMRSAASNSSYGNDGKRSLFVVGIQNAEDFDEPRDESTA
jgi:hypothetical protein